MSIPRFAIQRPVMMTMISSIIVLIGGISLVRLPVDLLPDISQPTITVRVNYTGAGPQEIEELITRPLEQQLSAVSGLEQMNSSSNEGNSQVRMNFTWGHDLNEAMDEIRTRIDRVRGRLPEDADPPQIQKFDSNSAPIMGLCVDRVVNVLRTENQNVPIGEIYQGDRAYLLRSQGQFETLEQIANIVVMTRTGVPVYLKDIADVKDTTEDNRSILRINGRPGVRMQVTKQSGTNTVQIAEGVRAELERINREVPGVRLTLLDDSAKFIERSITAVQEHVMIGSGLVILIIFLF